MKMWIDDIRTPPDDSWWWAKTSEEALTALRASYSVLVGILPIPTYSPDYEVISFDHDLGGEDTTRPVMRWLCEYGLWPLEIDIHTMNNVGREWLLGMAARYAPRETKIYTVDLHIE